MAAFTFTFISLVAGTFLRVAWHFQTAIVRNLCLHEDVSILFK